MDKQLTLYQQYLDLENATFTKINHEDATVAVVYKITRTTDTPLILKVCIRPKDYANELYFLNYFANTLPIPRIVQVIKPTTDRAGAILMECLPGRLLQPDDFTDSVAYGIGLLLAHIHTNRTAGYGDLTQPRDLSPDPRYYFAMKFNEGLTECSNHLSEKLIKQCHDYYDTHINLLNYADGPCITHRDFRAGNVIIYGGIIQGIIDWSSARASFAQEDFCFFGHGDWPITTTTQKSFLAGYASVRPVPDYSAMMPLLRLSRAIAVIGFAIKRGTWQGAMASKYQFNRQFLDDFFKKLA